MHKNHSEPQVASTQRQSSRPEYFWTAPSSQSSYAEPFFCQGPTNSPPGKLSSSHQRPIAASRWQLVPCSASCSMTVQQKGGRARDKLAFVRPQPGALCQHPTRPSAKSLGGNKQSFSHLILVLHSLYPARPCIAWSA
jgi:hypothetical protein